MVVSGDLVAEATEEEEEVIITLTQKCVWVDICYNIIDISFNIVRSIIHVILYILEIGFIYLSDVRSMCTYFICEYCVVMLLGINNGLMCNI